jgi:hypothetical protein
MEHTVNTTMCVLDIPMIRMFLDANGLQNVKLSWYEVPRHSFVIDRYVCYTYCNEDTETLNTLTILSLKYGSLELAVNDFIKSVRSRYF